MGRTPWAAIAVIYLCGVAAAMQIGKIPPLGTAIRSDLAMGLPAFGWTVSVVQAVAVVLGVIGGLWITRADQKRLLMLGMAATGACGAAAALVPSGDWLLAARAAEGMGYLLVVLIGPTLIARLSSEADRGLALSIWSTFVPVGLALSNAAAGWAEAPLGWRLTLVGFAVAILAMVPVTLRVVPRIGPAAAAPADRARPFDRLKDIYTVAPALRLAAAFGAFTFTNVGILALLPTHLAEQRGLDSAAAGSLAGMVALANVPGSLGVAVLLRRGWAAGPLALFVSLAAIPAVVPVWLMGSGTSLAVAAAVTAMVLNGAFTACIFAAVPGAAGSPARLGPANGLIVQFGSLGATLGPPGLAAVADSLGWPAVGAACGVSLATAGTLAWLAWRSAADVPAPGTASAHHR